jgi:hypothetical protein
MYQLKPQDEPASMVQHLFVCAKVLRLPMLSATANSQDHHSSLSRHMPNSCPSGGCSLIAHLSDVQTTSSLSTISIFFFPAVGAGDRRLTD